MFLKKCSFDRCSVKSTERHFCQCVNPIGWNLENTREKIPFIDSWRPHGVISHGRRYIGCVSHMNKRNSAAVKTHNRGAIAINGEWQICAKFHIVVWTVNHSKLECCKNCNEISTCPDYYLCLLILNIFAVVEV